MVDNILKDIRLPKGMAQMTKKYVLITAGPILLTSCNFNPKDE